jgi:thiamine-phosphate pyrophosphorylase
MRNNVAPLLRLMLVTDDRLLGERDLVALALAAERGGITALQLRLKQATARAQAELVRALVRALRVPVLVNDRPGSEAEAGHARGADYWGIGPWRETATKGDAGSGLGPEGFRHLVELAGDKPCIAIGGVTPDDVPLVRTYGGTGVAVISGILGEEDVEAAARAYRSRER